MLAYLGLAGQVYGKQKVPAI